MGIGMVKGKQKGRGGPNPRSRGAWPLAGVRGQSPCDLALKGGAHREGSEAEHQAAPKRPNEETGAPPQERPQAAACSKIPKVRKAALS